MLPELSNGGDGAGTSTSLADADAEAEVDDAVVPLFRLVPGMPNTSTTSIATTHHIIVAGAAGASYGLACAARAGVAKDVIARARAVSAALQQQNVHSRKVCTSYLFNVDRKLTYLFSRAQRVMRRPPLSCDRCRSYRILVWAVTSPAPARAPGMALQAANPAKRVPALPSCEP